MRKRYTEMKALIKKAIEDLGQYKQPELVGDVFEIYFKEHVQKMQKTIDDLGEIEDAYLFELSKIMYAHSERQRAIGLLEVVVNTCVSSEFKEYNQ